MTHGIYESHMDTSQIHQEILMATKLKKNEFEGMRKEKLISTGRYIIEGII